MTFQFSQGSFLFFKPIYSCLQYLFPHSFTLRIFQHVDAVCKSINVVSACGWKEDVTGIIGISSKKLKKIKNEQYSIVFFVAIRKHQQYSHLFPVTYPEFLPGDIDNSYSADECQWEDAWCCVTFYLIKNGFYVTGHNALPVPIVKIIQRFALAGNNFIL